MPGCAASSPAGATGRRHKREDHLRSFATLALAALALVTAPAHAAEPFDALRALATPNYTGGLTREDRAVAERIHAQMAPRYTATCSFPGPDPFDGAGTIVDPKGTLKRPVTDDPDLAALIQALDSPSQEIRDVATYTIGLLGPSAKGALHALGLSQRDHDKHGWSTFTHGALECQTYVGADFREALPNSLLPPPEPWHDYLVAAARLMPKLYLDPDIEYPPDMMGEAFRNYALPDAADGEVARLLAQILDDERLSIQKRREAAQALDRMHAEFIVPARGALQRAARSQDARTRFFVTRPLVALHDEAVIPAIVAAISDRSWGDWSDQLCTFGPAAIAAQDRLLELARRPAWLRSLRAAVRALGCIGSAKAEPLLAGMLEVPDWQLNMVAAKAIGNISAARPDTRAILHRLAAKHWSKKVRTAAQDALDTLAAHPPLPPPPKPAGSEIITIGGSPGPFDHGLPWCDLRGRFSVDGKRWFKPVWHLPALAPVPRGFTGTRWVQGIGTQSFLAVPGGWLMGSDGFEGEGVLLFVPRHGAVQALLSENGTPTGDDATIAGIVRVHGRIYAFGYEILRAGGVGSLFELSQKNGRWRAERVLALPSFPGAFAFSPQGDLLLADPANTVAVVDGAIVPLQCATRFSDSYFSSHSEDEFELR